MKFKDMLSKLRLRAKTKKLDEPLMAILLEISHLVGTVLYINEKRVGLVVNYVCFCPARKATITVDPWVDEYMNVIDAISLKLTQFQVHKTSEFKEDWMVEEILMLSRYRHFNIKVEEEK